MSDKIVHTNVAHIQLIDDYLLTEFDDMCTIDVDEAKEMTKLTLKLCEGKPYPFITSMLGITVNINSDARDFFANNEDINSIRTMQAIIVNNTPSKLVANFFIKYHKPAVKTKLFTNFDEALKWVRSNS